MENLDIILGAVLTIGIFLLGYSVAGVFNGKRKIEELEKFIDVTDDRVTEVDRERNFWKEDTYATLEHLHEEDDNIKKLLDSRLDRLESRIVGLIPPTNEELMKRIEKIEEESYRLRMNM
jgi:hypothetical protein